MFGFKTKNEDRKNIVIFNTYGLGDVLLNNSLCQNIKRIYPNSRLIFVANKPFEEAAKYQLGVDEAIVYDKNGRHKGSIIGPVKFALEFPYKNIFAAFITYRSGRSQTVVNILRPKHTFAIKKRKKDIPVQKQHNRMLEGLVDEKIINYPIKFEIPKNIQNTTREKFNLKEKYIVLCCITNNPPKDIPKETAIELIRRVNKEANYKVVLIGTGRKTEDYANEIKKVEPDFIDLVNKTTITELADIIKNSEGLISADTGVMHLGYAVDAPTVAVFYEQHTIPLWAPPKELYNTTAIVSKNQTPENILSALQKLKEEMNKSNLNTLTNDKTA